MHQLLADQIQKLGLGSFYEVLGTEIRGRNGTKIVYAGLADQTAESIKSYEGIDICWLEEARNITRRSLDILIPTIRKEGSEIWITFNPELDTDEVYKRFVVSPPEDAYVAETSYKNNPWFPSVLDKERRELLRQVELGNRDRHEYEHIWEGRCKPSVDGAIFTKQIDQMIKDGRYTHVAHNPALYTHTVWDLGYNGMSIGFVQRAASTVQVIDHINVKGHTYEDCVQLIRKRVNERGYRIALDGRSGGKAWLPHDGKQTRPDKGKSPINQLNEMGLETDLEGIPDLGIAHRLEAAKQMFSRTWIDRENCADLYNSVRRYAQKLNPDGQPGAIKKDGNDHDGDMFSYIAVIENELVNEAEPVKIDFTPAPGFAF